MLIRRRPSVATLVAVLSRLCWGVRPVLPRSRARWPGAPQAVGSVEVTATDGSSVTIAWPPSAYSDSVVSYGVYLNGAQVGTQTADQTKRWRDRQAFSYTIKGLACGTGYTVGVDAVDRDDDHSPITTTTVSTSACPDTTPPSAPSGMRQVAATENSVVLAWTPSSDNVGVVEYGLYASGVRVSTVSDANATLTSLKCGTSYLIAIDAADAAGNRSAQASSFFRTSACPSTNKPPSTPTLVRVAKTTQTSVALSWTASTDDVGVTGYGLYLSGSRTSETTGTSGDFTGLKCGTTYTLGVDAKDAGGLRSAVATLSTATSPCSPPPPSSTGTVTQTIANGSTLTNLVNWRAVYDANGDGIEDDPGSIQFLRRRQPGALRDQPAVRRHLRQRHHHRQQRPAHLPGARPQRQRHPARHQHRHRHRQQPDATAAAAELDGHGDADDRERVDAPESRQLARRLRQQRRRRSRTTPARSSSSSTATRCSPRSTRRSATPSASGHPSPSATASTPSRCAPSTTAAPCSPPTPSPPPSTTRRHHRRRPVTRSLRRSPATSRSRRRRRRASRSPGTPPPTTSASPATTSTAARVSVGTTPQTTATFNGLTCGTGYPVGVDAFDAAGNASPPANMTVTTSRVRRHAAAHGADQRHRLDAHHHQHRAHLGARHRQRRRRRLRRLQRRRPRRHHRRHHRHRQRPHLRHQLHPLRRRLRRNRQQLTQDHHHGLHPPLHRHHPTHPAHQPAHHLGNHHQPHPRLERRHRQRRRRQLRHLPRRHQGRHRHHHQLPHQRAHLRNQLHASASEPSTPPATPPPRPPPHHHLTLRRHPGAHRRRPTSPSRRAPARASALSWTAATDNVGVASYGVYNGAQLVNNASGTTSTVSGLACGTSYALAVDAVDAAGNRSGKSAVTASTSSCSASPTSTSCPLPAYPNASCTGVPAGTTLTAYTGPRRSRRRTR